ncbi:KH domain protein [Cooperia oncophora]
MIIRNSDSGKIMGVKGRRVALVEQMTNTVISFQKVDPKSKERTLTITASSMEDIDRAKDLIIDTIRRNMSPIRAEASGHDSPAEEDENENDISIETTHDGMLKLCCSDPQVLQAAQEALSQYLRSRAKPSAAERELRKERRKSMPLQASQPDAPAKPLSRTFHGSTPNLAEAGLEAVKKTTNSTQNREVDELNKVFVSLRQACCRDNGQLGTPCRLKNYGACGTTCDALAEQPGTQPVLSQNVILQRAGAACHPAADDVFTTESSIHAARNATSNTSNKCWLLFDSRIGWLDAANDSWYTTQSIHATASAHT